MTELGHRPGPWVTQWHNGRLEVVTQRGDVVARAAEGPRMTEDAALIAAAPDLIRVLRDVERIATELGAKGYPLNAIRAALFRAEGVF